MSKHRKPPEWAPAALERMFVLIKIGMADMEDDDFHFTLDLDRPNERRWEIRFNAEIAGDESHPEDSVVEVTIASEWMRGRWRIQPIQCIKDGEEYDTKNDFRNVLKILNPNEYGAPGESHIHRTAGAKRDRGVEVRTTTVVRI